MQLLFKNENFSTVTAFPEPLYSVIYPDAHQPSRSPKRFEKGNQTQQSLRKLKFYFVRVVLNSLYIEVWQKKLKSITTKITQIFIPPLDSLLNIFEYIMSDFQCLVLVYVYIL